MYRVEISEEERVEPTKASRQKYGNMFGEGDVSEKNFLMKKISSMPKKVVNRRDNETMDASWLFNNLPLSCRWYSTQDLVIVTLAVRSVFRNFPVFEVNENNLEFIPTPIENYTLDACVRFMDNKGGKHIIAIETK